MNFHWQNLNDKPGGRQGPGWIHGRAWLRLTDDYRGSGLNWCWALGRFDCHASFEFTQSEEVGIKFSFAIPFLLALYVTIYGGPFSWAARKLLPEYTWENGQDREVSLRVFSGAIWWEVWRDNMAGTGPRTKRWRHGNFNPLDFFLGRQKYSERDVSITSAVVPMPERSYPCTVRLFESTWKRPRWPFPQQRIRADVDCKANPIPFPGKGENSWDCGQDATYSLTTQASTVEEGIAAMVETVMRSRRRHGGSVNWKPEPEPEQARAE